MGLPQEKPAATAAANDDANQRPIDKFKGRQTKEIVLGFAGPIGCGLAGVITTSETLLREMGYQVRRFKLSDFIEEQIRAKKIDVDSLDGTGQAATYHRKQTGGNVLRDKYGDDILAEYAVTHIAVARGKLAPKNADIASVVPERTAYIVDQLKHPAEIRLLTTVYRNAFYLIGATSHTASRLSRLSESGMTDEEARKLIERDRRDNERFGQQLEKAMQHCDVFVRTDPGPDAYRASLNRFFQLLHGTQLIGPTTQEYGMYVAHAAKAGSACLSRQVGAAIVSKDGATLATGRNDVPKYGGGLYTPEDGAGDERCYKSGGYCRNTTRKLDLKDKIEKSVASLRDVSDSQRIKALSDDDIVQIVQKAFDNSGIPDLIEFSRSVHAEMDAIVTVAREGTASIRGATLYTTTFPCHSCARHIVAAGIERVYYIEPYEKSLASDLHADAIAFDNRLGVAVAAAGKRVEFVHFEGIAPSRYLQFFMATKERKNEATGKLVVMDHLSLPVAVEYLDPYRDFEAKVTEDYEKRVGGAAG